VYVLKIYPPGSVFRVSPNELSFASVSSWKDIYGHPTGGRPTMVKSEFYDLYGAGFKSLCVGSERDPHRHGQMRKSLSSAFSTKSLSEQEHIVNQVVDKFLGRIGEVGEKEGSKGVNVTKWYEMVSFDILGEMAFGESFHCVQNGSFRLTLCVRIVPLSHMADAFSARRETSFLV
jgi:hypothetical protein